MSNSNENKSKPVVVHAIAMDSYEGFHALRQGAAKSLGTAKKVGAASALGTLQRQPPAFGTLGRGTTNTSKSSGKTKR
ncbi:hypothetical protein [Dyella sp.]|uniref:hypothetical protein n=1 Tax=Dyella sp. TaxID=1869338 RepID=UPI002D770C9B|nr:hypothetical protein [Dyella sp.]HET7330257.1 hypothetical protein [Dyella sp.]